MVGKEYYTVKRLQRVTSSQIFYSALKFFQNRDYCHRDKVPLTPRIYRVSTRFSII